MARFAVGMKFEAAIDVLGVEIEQTRKELYQCDNHEDAIFGITANFQSSDDEIIRYIAASKYRQAEILELEIEEVSEYSKSREAELEKQDRERGSKTN